MASARLMYRNLAWDSTTAITPSVAAATGYATTNLISTERNIIYRSTAGTADVTIEFAFSGSKTVKAVVAGNYAIFSGGSFRAEYWTGAAWATYGTFTIPASNRTRLVAVYGSQATTKIRYYFVYGGAGAASVDLGVAYIVDSTGYIDTSAKLSNERGIKPIDPSECAMTVGGMETWNKKQKTQVLWGAWPVLPQADLDSLMQAWDVVGTTDPVVWTQNATNMDQTIYGRMEARPEYRHVSGGQWATTMAVREAA